jgi:alkanesulfonate monooxygenase SsuD/methylene tetrahydromethanopterin reductase-like flavin-dependent oxidoreductase (luciferase family)
MYRDGLPPENSLNLPFDELHDRWCNIGSPDDCVEQLLCYQERLRTHHLLLRMQWAGMPQEQVLEAIESFGERSVPGLQDVWQPDGGEE